MTTAAKATVGDISIITDFRLQHKYEKEGKSVKIQEMFEKIIATMRESYNGRPHIRV
jgi:hypothetical protein